MKQTDFRFDPTFPEQPILEFLSTGSCGGDAGHGGFSVLTLSAKSGNGFLVSVTDANGETAQVDDASKIMISIAGDWELEGFALALLELGRHLIARDDVMDTRAFWLTKGHGDVFPLA